jgi:sporulation integral membrane protein YlbJ
MKSRYVFISIVVFFMVLLIIYPEKYIVSIASGLNLYAINVLPALFPFIFFSKILSELNFGYDLGNIMDKPLKKLYGVSGVSGYIMVMSMLSGYPIGAKLLSDMYEKNYITTKEARTVSAFTSTSGPLFIIGTVGIAMLGNKLAGFIMLFSHYLATLLNGLIYRTKNNLEKKPLLPPLINSPKVLSESMTNSIISIAIVGGYISIFVMVLDVFTNLGLINFVAQLLSFTNLNINIGIGFVSSLVEITKGCLIMSQSGYSLKIIVPLCTFGITFGGLSITLQSMTFLSKCKIKPAFYLLSKFTQALISLIISFPICYFLF